MIFKRKAFLFKYKTFDSKNEEYRKVIIFAKNEADAVWKFLNYHRNANDDYFFEEVVVDN